MSGAPTEPDSPALRQADRLRRREDAARLLPLFGAALVALPLLWRGALGWATAPVLVYLFAVWAGLILAAALLARVLGPEAP